MSKVLYLCDPSYDFLSAQPHSQLVTESQDLLSGDQFHTSILDNTTEILLKIAPNFDEIVLWELGFDKQSTIYKDTKALYSFLIAQKHAIDPQTQFLSTRHSKVRDQKSLLWVFGCSHSAGVGLTSGQMTYGKLLADRIARPLQLIARPGSSLHWSTRHLFAAPILPQDKVIWQITSPGRLTRFDGNSLHEILLASCQDRSLVDSIQDWQLYFDHFSLINFGVRYLRNIGCDFAMISMIGKRNEFDLQYLKGYVAYKEYCPTTDIFVDHGIDGLHPGPDTHKNLALRLFNHVK